ncbi:hypothetical protein TSOC111612_22770 [Tsukamurella ocularis]
MRAGGGGGVFERAAAENVTGAPVRGSPNISCCVPLRAIVGRRTPPTKTPLVLRSVRIHPVGPADATACVRETSGWLIVTSDSSVRPKVTVLPGAKVSVCPSTVTVRTAVSVLITEHCIQTPLALGLCRACCARAAGAHGPYRYCPVLFSVSIAREALEFLPVTSVRM